MMKDVMNQGDVDEDVDDDGDPGGAQKGWCSPLHLLEPPGARQITDNGRSLRLRCPPWLCSSARQSFRQLATF
jgi:hypothetical protein